MADTVKVGVILNESPTCQPRLICPYSLKVTLSLVPLAVTVVVPACSSRPT